MSESLTPKVVAALKAMHNDLEKWHYTRELAQLSKAGRSTISDEFPRLVKLGILNQRREGREVYYRFNLTNPKTRKLCELFETEKREEFYKKSRRLSWSLQDFTKRVFDFLPQIQSAILFGSAARRQLTKTSDVDVLIIVPNIEQEAFNTLMKSIDALAADVRGRYGFPISAVTMTMKDFESALREKKRISQDVLHEGVVLFGEERYYQLLARVFS